MKLCNEGLADTLNLETFNGVVVMNWKNVVGYEGYYRVSDSGNVISVTRYDRLGRLKVGVIKRTIIQNSGYKVVNLKVDGEQKNHLVHRLVAEVFIPNPDNKKFVNHINGNKLNNEVSNLEWCTRSENMKHATEIGLADIVNRKEVKVTTIDGELLMFKSQFEVSNYFGFTNGWCHQRILRNGNPFNYNGNLVEVL
jgi:hypothetical protein